MRRIWWGNSGVALCCVLTACRAATAVEGNDRPSTESPGIRVEALGGIATLRTVYTLDSAAGSVFWSNGPLCDPGAACPATDSARGLVAEDLVRSLFARAQDSGFRALPADHGATTRGADMRTWLVTIHGNGRVRQFKADDGTMPTLLAHFVNDVGGAVLEAVRR